MNKDKFLKICDFASVALVVVFIVKNIVDYLQYDPNINSAPFEVWIIANIVYFIVPTIIIQIIKKILLKK
jgi:ABC-type arginine/histidine transport system permease subunit